MAVTLHSTMVSAGRDGPGLPLLMAHGLLGQGRNFGTLAKQLAADRDVHIVDMRNHGDSPWDDTMTYAAMAEDLSAYIDAEMDGRALVFGHSMGGKAAMRLALDAPARVAGLIVADIAPVTYTHSHLNEIDALRGLDLSAIARRSDADRALQDSVPDKAMRAFLIQNLDVSGDGTTYRSNLDVLAGAMPTLVGWDEPGAAPYDGPTLFIAGGASSYVRPKHEDTIRALFPQARIEVIPDGGHWIHAQKPRETLDLSSAFLAQS